MLPDPGDLHNMNHRVPAQRCLAGKSGLASLIIVRALALPVPRVSPAPASRGVFFAAVCPARGCLLAAAGSLGSHCQENMPRRAGAAPGAAHPSRGLFQGESGRDGCPRCPPAMQISLHRALLQGAARCSWQGGSCRGPQLHSEPCPGHPPRGHCPQDHVWQSCEHLSVQGQSRGRAGAQVSLLAVLRWDIFFPRGGWGRLQSCARPSPAISQAPLHGHTRMHAGPHAKG